MGKRLISLALIICMILTTIPFSVQAAEKSEWKPSTNDGWNIIDFNDTTNYKGDQYKISVTSAAEGWHYSGGHWKFTMHSVDEEVIIKDSEMKTLANGTLKSDAISKYLTATVELPTKVKEHLRNGGSLSDIKIKFDSGSIVPYEIFSGDCYYKIEGGKLKVSFKPIFNVSREAIYGKKDDSRMNVEIPQGKPGYSYTLYAIWSKAGVDLGVGYSKEAKMSGNSTILNIPDNRFIEAPEDIADATGSLKQNGKDYFYKDKFTGEVKKLDPTKAGIGYGTFQGGGAVGLMFLFPINATFYIDDGTNYVLIANGFVNDGTAATIDFIDADGILDDPLLGDLAKAYVDLFKEAFYVQNKDVVYGKSSVTQIVNKAYREKDWKNESDESLREKTLDAVNLFTKITANNQKIELALTNYVLDSLYVGREYQNEIERYWGEEHIKATKRALYVGMLDYILRPEGLAYRNKYNFNYGKYGLDIVYNGTEKALSKGYSSLADSDSDKLRVQIGPDKKLQDKILEEQLTPILYKSLTIHAIWPTEIPKDALKHVVNAYIEDLITELNNISVNSNYPAFKSAENILNKWKSPEWETDEMAQALYEDVYQHTTDRVFRIFAVTHSNDLAYGLYDDFSDYPNWEDEWWKEEVIAMGYDVDPDYYNVGPGFKTVEIDEAAITNLFNAIIILTGYAGSDRVVKDSDGNIIDLKKVFEYAQLLSTEDNSTEDNSTYYEEGTQSVRSIEEIMTQIMTNDASAKKMVGNDSINSIIRYAAAEASSRSNTKFKEDYAKGTVTIEGDIGVALIMYDEAIPVDLYVVTEDENGNLLPILKKDKYVTGVANMQKIIDLAPQMSFTDSTGLKTISVDMKKAVFKPATEDLGTFLNKLKSPSKDANGKEYIDFSNKARAYIKEAPFEINNLSKSLDTPNIDGIWEKETKQNYGLMFALTDTDKAAYKANSEDRPALIVWAEPSKKLLQVNVVEDEYNQTESVTVVSPTVDASGKVTLTPPSGKVLKEWLVSPDLTSPLDTSLEWSKVASLNTISSGDSATSPVIDTNVDNIIYVRYGTPSAGVSTSVSGDLVLSQNRITKAYNLSALGTIATFNFSYGSSGSHYHPDYQDHDNDPTTPDIDVGGSWHDRTSPVDSNYTYVIKHSNTLNNLAIGLNGAFNIKYNGTNVKSGTASWNGETNSVSPNMFFVAWRGKDKPTLASYKESASNPLVTDLGLPIGKTPQSPRNTAGGYTDSISVVLEKSNDGADYSTTFTDGDDSETRQHTTGDSATYTATLGVKSFIGAQNSGSATSGNVTSSFTAGGVTFNHAKGYPISSENWIKFYPYVQMAYDTPATAVDGSGVVTRAVNVLAAHESSIKPVDYVEVGWTNSNPANSLTLNSTQWSTHKRAVDKWGKNNVLPGGAIYTLDTKSNVSKVGITTWQHYIPSDQINNVTAGNNYFTQAEAEGKRQRNPHIVYRLCS